MMGAVPDPEAVEIIAAGAQPPQVHMYAVTHLRGRQCRTFHHHIGHGIPLRHLPVHQHRLRVHAIVQFGGPGGQTGPDHEAVGQRIPGGHTQLEGVIQQTGLGFGAAAQQARNQGCRGHKGGAAQQVSA